MLVLLLALLRDRSRSKRRDDLYLNQDIDLDPLATFAAALGLQAHPGRTWRDPQGQILLDEDALQLEIDLELPGLEVHRRGSPHLTGSPLDLLLRIQGEDAAIRGALEEESEALLRWVHGQGAEISKGVLRWRVALGELHSFTPVLPDVSYTLAALRELRLLAKSLS
jgi:hypothetical protein